ncbi:kinase-like protein [Ramaria rubella]|nr:kinase-like protein [Ramaria rubella]
MGIEVIGEADRDVGWLGSLESGSAREKDVRESRAHASGAAAPVQVNGAKNFTVNGKTYGKLDMIGKGGSSRVYRVITPSNEIYALKRVSLDRTDQETMQGYMNEIALLRRLDGNERIIQLVESEVRGGSKGHLMLVMECGEVDLARLIAAKQSTALDMVWVSYYWKQMLEAVHVIHEEKIVHSDLKPANFVLVKGELKLIDFGIANAIANDTTNIQRDHQIGTVNYMSPESIEVAEGNTRLKVGRPSDVWSLGCILYQMIYGTPPFHQLSVLQKMRAIPDPSNVIDFPEQAIPIVPQPRGTSGGSNGNVPAPPKKLHHLAKTVPKEVIESLKSCLMKNPKERETIPQLLEAGWLHPKGRSGELNLSPDEVVIDRDLLRQVVTWAVSVALTTGMPQEGNEFEETLSVIFVIILLACYSVYIFVYSKR